MKRVDLLNMAHEIIQITLTKQESENLMLLEEGLGDFQSNATSIKPLIERAMLPLRKSASYDEKKMDRYFEPISVSFGPLHHVKECKQGSTIEKAEKFKRRLAAMFISYSGNQKEDLYKNVKKEIKSLKDCYDPIEVVDWRDEELAWMFLVDGCALLHFIFLYEKGMPMELDGLTVQRAIVVHDLFLLENQLPFQLLKILIDSCTGKFPQGLKDSIGEFIGRLFVSPVQTHPCQRQQQEEPVHLLALLRSKLIGQRVNCKSQEKDGLRKWPTYRNVKELKAKGIHFKAKEMIDDITDIDFNLRSCVPTVTLAPILVNDDTMPILLNLMAYEMSLDFINEFEITSYVAFLESLIDSGEDVKELRHAGVLNNGLGSDEAVAEMFNKISDYLVPNPEKYRELKERIQHHCDLAWASDVAYFCHTYFRGPWSFVVFVVTVAGLIMTGLQTYNSFN
ncbi:hypothetical protein SLA2020_016720 [Shorea laevis]